MSTPAPKCWSWICLLLVGFCGLGRAETNYTVLRSFGNPDQAGEGVDLLIEGADGFLYGSAGIGSPLAWHASADQFSRGIVFRMAKDGSDYMILHRFNHTNEFPTDLVYATNGVLYGTTWPGGQFGRGRLFRLNTDGTGFAVLHDFQGGTTDGDNPRGLMQASDGWLYGTTTSGGASTQCAGGCGTVFKIALDGTGFAMVRSFVTGTGQGRLPLGGLEEGNDGLLYGTTSQGGAANGGSVFRMNKDGTGYQTLVSFFGTNGAVPVATLLEATDGALYGTTQFGGAANAGLMFRVDADGSNFRVLHHFAGIHPDGSTPLKPLVEGTDGAIYGGTRPSSHSYRGTLFKANKDGSGYEILRTNLWPSRLVRGSDGPIYGAQTREVFRLAGDGSSYETVRPFTIAGGDGAAPTVILEASDGYLYGMTSWGGTNQYGDGGVFRIGKDGSGYTIVRAFVAENGGRGGSLIECSDGLLYGSKDGGVFGRGWLFRMAKDGSGFSAIYDFDGTNGSGPTEGLIEGSDGALYGNAGFGGNHNYGVVYKVNKDGTGYTVLHHFAGYAGSPTRDGAYPHYGLLEGSDGWLYGATHALGSAAEGMFFKLRKDGTGYQELYNFADLDASNSGPEGGLIEGKDGEIFGTSIRGGDHDAGTLFKLNKDGTGYRRLLSFPQGYFTDGKRVMQASDGALYGVTLTRGRADQGTVYRINTDGSRYSVLHDFVNVGGDGGGPWGGLIEGSDGALYGTTTWGGGLNVGTIFRIVPQPEVLSLTRQPNGHMQVTARALSGRIVGIESSTDLVSWTEIDAGAAVDGRFVADDPELTPPGHRFYRARLKDL